MTAKLRVVTDEIGDEQLRAELHLHIEQRDASLSLRDRARDAASRATEFVEKLNNALAEFDNVDSRIIAERASAFKRALANGQAAPMLSLSPELVAANAKRLDAESQLNAAKQAHMALIQELNDAEQTYAAHQANVEKVARAVVAFHADAMARELAALEQQAGKTRQLLLGVTSLRPGPAYPVSASTVSLLRDAPRNSVYGRETADDCKFWDSFRARLQLDSEAAPDE
jgi:DNA repair exonuclease SbcCD ATPase subunit